MADMRAVGLTLYACSLHYISTSFFLFTET